MNSTSTTTMLNCRRSGRTLAGLALALAVFALALGIGATRAFAATIPELPGDAEKQPRSGVPVPVQVSLDQPGTREIALQTLQEWRQEAYDEGIVDLPEGMTPDEYVHGVVWNQDLERIAIQRAIESAVADELAHTRTDGTPWFTATSNGVSAAAEGIAGSGAGPTEWVNDINTLDYLRASGSAKFGISLWKSEKSAYISNRTQGTNYIAGHYENMIDPAYKSYGFAYVGVSGGEWLKVVVEPGIQTNGVNEESVGYTGICDATVPVNDNECLTVALASRCTGGVVKVGESSAIATSASSSRTGSDTWELDPTYAAYTSSDPSVLTVDENGTVTGVAQGVATVTVTIGTETATVDVPVTDDLAAFRLYNPYSGEHFYTLDAQENADLAAAGWIPEGLGWVAPRSSGSPVYRLYNPYAGEHHYTMNASERDALVAAGWKDEGTGWRSDPHQGAVLYREYNPFELSCNHNYTTDKAEHDGLVALGWKDEGTAWYGVDVAKEAGANGTDSVSTNATGNELGAAAL